MSNQARASRHASGILPSKQFFAPRKPITQSVSLRRKSTSPIVPNSPNTQTSPTLQASPLSFTSTIDSPLPNIQSEEEGLSLLHQPILLSSLSPVATSPNPSLDQSLDSIFNPELSQSAPGRTSAPIRPPSALLIRRSYRHQSGDISQATIDSVLEPTAKVPVLESTTYRHSARQNVDPRDFAAAAVFTRPSDNVSPNTPSTKLHLISPKNTSAKQTPFNATAYSAAAKSMPRIIAQPDPMNDTSKRGHKRLYQVWPGRNRFFFGGRIMTSRDFPAFLIAFCALIIPSGLFMGFTCPYLYHNVSPAVVFIFVYFFLLALTSMLRTSWSDPGIIPRNLDPSPPTEDLEDPENNANNNAYFSTRSVPLPKEVKINGQIIRLKYCETCRIYRPPRCSHCRQCDNCVENEDHHCIWLNNCIGRRNYRTFFTFIATATILCFYVLGFSLVHLSLLMKESDNNFINSIMDAPVSFVLAVLTFFLMWSVGGLTCYHTYLISRNLTTHEQIRVPMRRNDVRNPNPFDYRRIYRNCLWVLCRPLTQNSVSRREFVDNGDLDEDECALNELHAQRTNNSANTETTIIEPPPKSKEPTNLEEPPITESREQQDQLNVTIV